MKIQTFSIVVGTRACNARCQFCVSRMTGFEELPKTREINVRNFDKAAQLATLSGTTTVLMTGKGEPTLYPAQITRYLELLQDCPFPLIEIQTNALEIGRLARDGKSKIPGLTEKTLRRWYDLGLNTIAISVVDIRPESNRAVYHEDYPDLATTISFLHRFGFSVRLCVMMQHPYVASIEQLGDVIQFCKTRKVEQLTVRSIRKPEMTHDADASGYVAEHGLADHEIDDIRGWIEKNGKRLHTLMHGAAVYDVSGQNLCLSDCLTVDASSDDIRTLIFYDDGRIAYDWQYDGAVLVGGSNGSDEPKPVQIRI